MHLVIAALLVISLFAPAQADASDSQPGMTTVETGQLFKAYEARLKTAIKANKMGIVATACATCGAKAIGVTIAENRIIMIFNPHFAIRMLNASIDAGVEAPLRLYLTENTDGTAQLRYQKPTAVFAPYGVPDLNAMAAELDKIVEAIVESAGNM